MAIAKKQTGKSLFKRQALNFRNVKNAFPDLKVSPDIPGMAPCPLCFEVFMEEIDGPEVVSREHAPPSKLGGKIVGLTCTNCNHTHGTILDSKLIEYYRVSESLKGEGSRFVNAKLQVNELPDITVKFKIPAENMLRVVPISKASRRETEIKINEILARSEILPYETVHFSFEITQPSSRFVRIALVRAAYLVAFGQFGYGFVINPALNYVRELLKSPEDEALYPHGVIFNYQIGDEFLGVSIITEPVELRAYIVVFDLFDGKRKIDRIAVILPGWTQDPMYLYKYLDSINGKPVTLSIRKIVNEIDFFTKAPLAPLQHWNELFAK